MAPLAKQSTAKRARCNKANVDVNEQEAEMPLAPGTDQQPSTDVEDPRSVEEILASIPPPPLPAMMNERGAPRLMITHIVNENFKSYAGRQILGPFHSRFSCIIGPNGSGKSNIIDSMLFVFGYRAQKIRSKKLSVLIHSSEAHQNLASCAVEVHFQKIVDKEEDDYDVLPGSQFYVSRSAFRDGSSSYGISGCRKSFKEVGVVLRSHGIDLDHNRFLILQGEVEQISLMKPKGVTEHDEGMLEYLEDIIGSVRYKDAIEACRKRAEALGEKRCEKLSRIKAVEKEKDALEEEKNKAVAFLTSENDVSQLKNKLLHQKLWATEKDFVQQEEQCAQVKAEYEAMQGKLKTLRQDKKKKTHEMQTLDKKLEKIETTLKEKKDEFGRCDVEDVKLREALKNLKSKNKKLQKQLQKEKEKVEDLQGMPKKLEEEIEVATRRKAVLEEQRSKVEAELKTLMASCQEDTRELHAEKEKKQRELLGLSRIANEARSRLEVAEAELQLQNSKYEAAQSQLKAAKEAQSTAFTSLAENHTTVNRLEKELPRGEKELKEMEAKLLVLNGKEEELRKGVRATRQRVEELRSALAASRSQGRVLRSLMEQKQCGALPGIYGRLMQVWVEASQKAVRIPNGVSRLYDLVKVREPAVKPAFYFALRNTLVADELTQATRVAFGGDIRWRVVTLQGQLIETYGTMSGGGRQVIKGKMGSALVSEVDQGEMERLEQEMEQKCLAVQHNVAERTDLETRVPNLHKSVCDMQFQLEKAAAAVQGLVEQEKALQTQVKELEATTKAAKPDPSKLRKIENDVQAFHKEHKTAVAQAGAVETEVQHLTECIVEATAGCLRIKQEEVDGLVRDLDACAASINKAKVGKKAAERNLNKAGEAMGCLEQELEKNIKPEIKLDEQIKNLEESAAVIVKECDEIEEKLKEVKSARSELFSAIRLLEGEEQDVEKEALVVRLCFEQVEAKVSEQQNAIQHWKKEISKLSLHLLDGSGKFEKLPQLSPTEAESLPSISELKNRIAVLDEQLQLEKPNMATIIEFHKKEAVYMARVAELDAITSERDEFRHAHEDLRRQRLDNFMSGFNIISMRLKENYQMLTQGGDAELELADSLDPFSDGIVFSVRPPKKSWKKIFNLSGGEKTLSSLALVFALHHFKPTPLYFMDEIDAALDFKNVSIVALYVYEQTKNAQFIIISLRNNMFEMADRLIGIYKTSSTTKSVAINPKTIVLPQITTLG
uniref:structural maintenance of chromosomes protein 4 isoform X2 n=1 Tax=Myxine glutinosa TaxID=7769 RepID=UPI00358E3385